jgi:hypothetical protein
MSPALFKGAAHFLRALEERGFSRRAMTSSDTGDIPRVANRAFTALWMASASLYGCCEGIVAAIAVISAAIAARMASSWPLFARLFAARARSA